MTPSAGGGAVGAPAPPGPSLVRDVILSDGRVLRLRSPQPEDQPGIEAFFEELDPEDRYMRFHGAGRPDLAAAAYAQADGHARVAFIAHRGNRVVAVAGYARLRQLGVAEVDFAVAPDFRRLGLATRMLEQLADHARAQGLARFEAEVLADNIPMLKVFRRAGWDVRREGWGGEVLLTLDLRPTERLAERVAERHHRGAVASLAPLLAPRSVAVVGASEQPDSIGGAIYRALVAGGYRGVAWPVNRSGGIVGSARAARSLTELPEPVDLAVLAVPAPEALPVVEDAGAAGVRALLVISAGFSDRDDAEGRAREAELLDLARRHGMRVLGPNSFGLLNLAEDVGLRTMVGRAGRLRPGRLAISSQSGALGYALLSHAAGRGLGVAQFVALGNRVDVSTNDLLEWWEDDADVAAVMLYMESFGNPQRFVQISRRVSRVKPIVAVKGRRGQPGDGAEMRSHTGAALDTEAPFDALFRQAGVLRVPSTQALFDAAELFESQPLPRGRLVAVVTNSGGLGTLAIDACRAHGLRPAGLSAETRQRLQQALPDADRIGNPIDMGIRAGAAEYEAAVDGILADDGVDAVLVYYTDLRGGDPEGILRVAGDAAARREKPAVACVLGPDGCLPTTSGHRIPNYRFPEACPAALALAAQRHEWLAQPLGQRPALADADADAARARVRGAIEQHGAGWLPLDDVMALLASHGIAVAETRRCRTREEAVGAAASLGGPVVLKAEFPPPAHAADVDAVLLGVEGEAGVHSAWDTLQARVAAAEREWLGATVQPLLGAGADVLLGCVVDPDLGPVLGLGMGGRQAGLAGDVAFRLLPETDAEADELITAAKAVSSWLGGFRGSAPLDREALRDLVLRFARLLEAVPELVEADLNPVRLMPRGCSVLDARVRIERRVAPGRVKTW